VPVSERSFNIRHVPVSIPKGRHAWQPEAVFVADGFFLKLTWWKRSRRTPSPSATTPTRPSAPATSVCSRTAHPVRTNFLHTPDLCRRCTVEGVGPEVRRGRLSPWTQEYLKGRAYMPGYLGVSRKRSVARRALIVYNDLQKAQLEPFHENVRVVPGGVHPDRFRFSPPPPREAGRGRWPS